MEDSLSAISDAVEVRDSLPRPNWEVIAPWVDSNVNANLFDETWNVGALSNFECDHSTKRSSFGRSMLSIREAAFLRSSSSGSQEHPIARDSLE